MDIMDTNLQRRLQLGECLLEMMQSVPFQRITVAEICNHLGIARKTFYYYYASKDDCLSDIVDRKIQEAALYATTAPPDDAKILQKYLANLNYWKSQKTFLDSLLKNNLGWILLERCTHYVLEEEKRLQEMLDTPVVKFDVDILNFYMNGQISMMLQWCLRGFDTPVEEMAHKYLRLMHSPLLPPEAQCND